MNQKTTDYIRGMLSSKVRDLLAFVGKAPAATDDLEAASSALVEFVRNGSRPVEDNGAAAFTALDTVVSGKAHLDTLDKFFSGNSSNGTDIHQFVKKLKSVALSVEPAPAPDEAR